MLYAQKDSMPQELGTYYQKGLDRAQKRYLSAIKALALVRKLALPVLQVNIACKQVNVAGPCPAATAGASAPPAEWGNGNHEPATGSDQPAGPAGEVGSPQDRSNEHHHLV
jgi:hypothetical protein